MKKRPIFVSSDDYQGIIDAIVKSGKKCWNETETFYVSKLTIALSVLGFILGSVFVYLLNS